VVLAAAEAAEAVAIRVNVAGLQQGIDHLQ